MALREPTTNEWRLAQGAYEYAPRIERTALVILQALAEKFNDKAVGGVDDLKFTEREGAGLAYDVQCAYGVGRIRFAWTKPSHSLEMLGELRFERKAIDAFERTHWEHCLSVYLPVGSRWYTTGGNDEEVIRDWSTEDKYFALGMMIKYGIMVGPLTV